MNVLPSGTTTFYVGESGQVHRRRPPPSVNVLPPGTTPFYVDEAGQAHRRPLDVLPRGTTPLVIDEVGRAQSPGTLKFLEHGGKREMRAAKAIPPLPLSEHGPAVESMYLKKRQKKLPNLLKAVEDQRAYLSVAEVDEFRKQHEACDKLLAEVLGDAQATLAELREASASFTAFDTKATRLLLAAGLAELEKLMQEVEKLGEDIDPDGRDGFTKYNEACRRHLDKAVKRNPLPEARRTWALRVLYGVRDRAEKLQEQAAETRRNKVTLHGLFERAETATQRAFRPIEDSRTPRQVLDGLQFDKVELLRMQDEVASAITALQEKKRPTTEQVDGMRTLLEPFESRVTESRGFLDDIDPRTPSELENPGTPVKLVNNNMRRDWTDFVKEARKPDRTLAFCREWIANIRAEIDRKTEVTDRELLELLNKEKKGSTLTKVPQTLLDAAYGNKLLLKQSLAYERRANILERLLNLVDVRRRLPDLLDTAQKPPLNLNSAQVEQVLRTYKGSATDTEKLFTNIGEKLRDTGKNTTWFLSREGGQTLVDLARILRHQDARIWTGDTCSAPRYGPLAGPAVPFDRITKHAVLMAGASRPSPGGYAGNRKYGNGGFAPDMALPNRTSVAEAITYKEYDIRPYFPGVNRGAERVVVGSDGRKYYTNDHYESFRLIT